jgi:hypothetical protein
MYKKILLTCVTIFSSLSIVAHDNHREHETHKLVVLISIPRSLTTAFLRAMKQCNFLVMNEPGILPYQQATLNHDHLIAFTQSSAIASIASFAEVQTRIKNQLISNDVFIKDFACDTPHYIFEQGNLINNQHCYVIFLIRDPHASLVSIYRKLNKYHTLHGLSDESLIDPLHPLTNKLMSYEFLYHTYEMVKASAHHTPIIVCAEDICTDAEHIMKQVCNFIDIPFNDKIINWQAHDDVSSQNVLGDDKPQAISAFWHSDALHSTQFHALTTYAVDHEGLPTFEEISDKSLRVKYQEVYKECLPYYEKLKQLALK